MHDPTDIRQQESAAKDRDERARIVAQRAGQDVKKVMQTEHGRRFVRRLLEVAGVFRSSFNNSGSITAFNEGQRNLGLLILADLMTHCPDDFVNMMKDTKDE